MEVSLLEQQACRGSGLQGLGQGPCPSAVWDVANPNAPVHELKGGSSLMCISYSLKDANLLGAGQYNGQFSVFDARKGSAPAESSLIEHSHRWITRQDSALSFAAACFRDLTMLYDCWCCSTLSTVKLRTSWECTAIKSDSISSSCIYADLLTDLNATTQCLHARTDGVWHTCKLQILGGMWQPLCKACVRFATCVMRPSKAVVIDCLYCRDPVYDMAWLQSKTGTECMSAASDGSILWWDIRKLAEPVERLTLTERGSEKVLGAVCLDYSPQAGPTKFVLGTEQGLLISGNRKAKTPADRIGTAYSGQTNPHLNGCETERPAEAVMDAAMLGLIAKKGVCLN